MQVTSPIPAGQTTPHAAGPVDAARLGLLGREAIGSHAATSGNAAELLVEAHEWLPRMFADLEATKAGDVIDVAQYNWEPSGPGLRMAELLKRKVREGVEVVVTTDRHGSLGTDSDAWRADRGAVTRMFDDMRTNGVQVRVNDPHAGRSKLSNPIKQHLDHRKMIVINHRVAYVGGMGLASSPAGKYDDWHDLFVRVEGPAAAQAGAEFVARANELGADITPRQVSTLSNAIQHPARVGAASVRTVANHPGIRADASADFFDKVASATTRLHLMTPYIGDQRIVDALVEAKRQNPSLDVTVLVPSAEVKQNPLFSTISRTFYGELIRNGIEVYGHERVMHAKAILSDDSFTIGSNNLTRGSFEHYMELSMDIDDPGVTRRAAAMLEADFTPARRITYDQVDGVGLRMLGTVRRLLGLWF